MTAIITSNAKRVVNCKAPFYPYDKKDDFGVSLKKGKNEVEFETEDHYNRFIQASESLLMSEEIVLGEHYEEQENKEDEEN